MENSAALRDVFAPKALADSPAAREAVRAGLEHTRAQALTDLRAALEAQTGMQIDDSAADASLAGALEVDAAGRPLTEETARRLRRQSGADAMLRFRVTDLGTTPRAWRKGYIAFEVVSTLAIAGIAYAHPATRPIAGIYLVEETAEETAEAYSGFWALNQVSRPVRIEGELISLRTRDLLWSDSATGFSDVALGRLFRSVGSAEREGQVDRATRSAANRLVAGLRDSVPIGHSHTPSPPSEQVN